MMAQEVKIDKGVPLPKHAPRRTGPPGHTYPWRTMKVGDSFVFPWRGSLRKTKQYATTACSRRKWWSDEAYRVETVVEDGKDLVRVWKVK